MTMQKSYFRLLDWLRENGVELCEIKIDEFRIKLHDTAYIAEQRTYFAPIKQDRRNDLIGQYLNEEVNRGE